MIGSTIKTDYFVEQVAVFGAGNQFIHHPGIAKCQAYLSLVHDLGQFTSAQQRHGIDRNRTGLGNCQPAGHHGRIVARTDQYTVAGNHAVIGSQCMGQPVAPVGQLLVRAVPAVPYQGIVITKALRHHVVGEFNGNVEVLWILEFRLLLKKNRPLLR